MFDLLTSAEASDRRKVFDVELLASRLLAASDWIRRQGQLGWLPRGYFGASTGAAAALWAAGSPGNTVRAVVSRGGCPDLADARLPLVRCPTLLIVGGADRDVLELNRVAATHLCCPCRLAVVPGATHLFEEPGSLEEVAQLSGAWFEKYLRATSAPGCGLTAVWMGLRPGEVLGLPWSAVDLKAGTLTVKQAQVRLPDGTFAIEHPKAGGDRTLKMPDGLTALLKAYKAQQKRVRLASPAWEEHGLVFTTDIGTPIDPSNLRRSVDELGVQIGIVGLSPNELRHTAISLLVDAGTHLQGSGRLRRS